MIFDRIEQKLQAAVDVERDVYVAELNRNTAALLHGAQAIYAAEEGQCPSCGLPTDDGDLCPRCDDEAYEGRTI